MKMLLTKHLVEVASREVCCPQTKEEQVNRQKICISALPEQPMSQTLWIMVNLNIVMSRQITVIAEKPSQIHKPHPPTSPFGMVHQV